MASTETMQSIKVKYESRLYRGPSPCRADDIVMECKMTLPRGGLATEFHPDKSAKGLKDTYY